MIYVEQSMTLQPGKVGEYIAIQNKDLMPIYSRVGIRLVGSCHTATGNNFEIVALFVYDDMAQMQKILAARNQDKDFIALTQKVYPLIVSSSTRIMEPNPWSPLK
jgi:hypothetical protein